MLVLLIGLSMVSYGQLKKPEAKKSTVKTTKISVDGKTSITDSIGEGRDPDVMVYKCIDEKTKEVVYVDLLELGYVGFFTNKTLVKYKVHMYSLTSRDSTWDYDYVSILFQNKMPIEAIQFNPDETKINIFVKTGTSGDMAIAELTITKKLSGFSEFLYRIRKNKYATFVYGDDKIPVYIKYEPKK